MREVPFDLDETLDLGEVDFDAAVGTSKMDGKYVRVVYVRAANEFTIPFPHTTPSEDLLRLATAIVEWDCGMADASDSPFHALGPAPAPKAVIKAMIPRMLPCEFRDLFCSTYRIAVPA